MWNSYVEYDDGRTLVPVPCTAEDFMNIIIHLRCLLEAIRLERDEGFPSLQVLHTREAKTD